MWHRYKGKGYGMMEVNKIYQGDSVSLLDGIPDKTIDLVCTDPPYLVTSRGGSGNMGGVLEGQGD